MRRFDKSHNMRKANILAEQRYYESKGLLKEDYDSIEENRTSMSEFFGDTTDNVDTLLKMFSKYQPTKGWFMTVGYVNNVMNSRIPASFNAEDIGTFEEIAAKLESPTLIKYAQTVMDSPDWERVKQTNIRDIDRASRGLGKQGKVKDFTPKRSYKNPYASVSKGFKNPETGKVTNEIVSPAKIYSTKSFTVQWENIRNKSDRDSEITKVRDKYGITGDEGSISVDDKRGLGYNRVQGTPFKKHDRTGKSALDMYAKGGVTSNKSNYFINFEGNIAELTSEEQNFVFKEFVSREKVMPRRLASMENQEAAQEIYNIENIYQMKNLNLEKISYIICSINVDGQNQKFSYINRNAVPDGLKPGEFSEFIEGSLPNSIS